MLKSIEKLNTTEKLNKMEEMVCMFKTNEELNTTEKLNEAFNIDFFNNEFDTVLSESFKAVYDAAYNVEVETTTSRNISKDFDELVNRSRDILLKSMSYAFDGFKESFPIAEYEYKSKLMMTAYGNVKVKSPNIRINKLERDFIDYKVLKFLPRTRISEHFTPEEWMVIRAYINEYNIFVKSMIIESSKPVINQDAIADDIYYFLFKTLSFIFDYKQIGSDL